MSQSFRPVHYCLDIRPDLERFQFKGQVEIRFETSAEAASVTLNIRELAIWQCRLVQDDQSIPCPFTQDPARETLTIELPQARQPQITLVIDYEGLINDAMDGFYRSRFLKDGQTRYLAVTQFQENSARRAFPCMDHPLYKAVFELKLTIPVHFTAIANTEPVKEEVREGLKTLTFAPTPVMSTYLVFFGFGDFQYAQDTQDARVRLAHLPGLDQTTDLGLEFGRKALHYCEDYYGIPYPLSKMDLIAVPDFAFGAMENWGAITFRENLLLRYPGITSRAGAQRICEIIAHEIAHQWFGNLVTPSDWKYLWLNESFATYFGYGVVAHHHPQWQIWNQFLNGETATALARDGLVETIPIEMPGGEKISINASTAPIIYNKGASILRMVEGYIGHPAYQEGVRAYLNTHTYACAQSHHLWEAFEKASAQPVTAIMQSWINQPGHPLVKVRRRGDTLHLEQRRFTYLDQPADQTWLIPITLTAFDKDGTARPQSCLMDQATLSLDLPPGTTAYKLNTHHTGFYRSAYDDPDNLAALGAMVARGVLNAQDRWGLQNDLHARLRQGKTALADYLDFLSHYKDETDYLPLTSMAGSLYQLYLLSPDPGRPSIADRGRQMAEQVLRRIGLTPDEAEPQTTSMLRDQLLWNAVAWGSREIGDFLEARFQVLTQGGQVHADIIKATLQTGAFLKGTQALDWIKERFATSTSEHERMNVLAAMGAFRQWPLTEQALAFSLGNVPPRNSFVPIVAAAANPVNQPNLWSWYLANRPDLEKLHPLLYERVITGVWPWAGLDREAEVNAFAQDYRKTHPGLEDAVTLALENLEINRRTRSFIS